MAQAPSCSFSQEFTTSSEVHKLKVLFFKEKIQSRNTTKILPLFKVALHSKKKKGIKSTLANS